MGSFGENLRREREMRGVTLEEISAATKISVRFFHAIEAEDFSKLPGGIFNRSFVRSYARYLGLDEEHILAEYQLVAKPHEDFSLKRLSAAKPGPTGEASRSPVVTLVVAAVLLSGGYAVYRYSRRAGEAVNSVRVAAAPTPAPSQSQSGTAAGTAPSATATAATPAPGAGTEQNKPGTAEAPQASSGPAPATAGIKGAGSKDGLVLQVAATERVWVGVDADGKTALQRVLNPNEVETVKAKQFFDVTTGNAEGIVLTLNGETLRPLGRRGEVKSVHLTYDDLKNPAP